MLFEQLLKFLAVFLTVCIAEPAMLEQLIGVLAVKWAFDQAGADK